MTIRATLVALAVISPAPAFADPAPQDDGYCDYVEAAAAATAASLFSPQLFGQFGYIEQPAFAVTPPPATPPADANNLRVIAGIRYSLIDIYAGIVTKQRAAADCRRHEAQTRLPELRGAVVAPALEARLRVYDEAQAEAQRLLTESQADLAGRRTTAPEAMATRMRVEELRALAAQVRRELAALPPIPPAAAAESNAAADALARFYRSDSELERHEARLRTIRNYELGVRAGVDRFLDGSSQDTRYFAIVELGVKLGALWVGGDNDRAASGRARYARASQNETAKLLDATLAQARLLFEIETAQAAQTAALVADLDLQIGALANIAGEDSKRFRATLWFDSIKAKAELAYLKVHVATLNALLGSAR